MELPNTFSLTDLGKKLLEAAKHGDDVEVGSLMAKGAAFTTDWLGTSPLHLAAQFGHLNTSKVLMRAGMSFDAKTKVDKTPLHLAAQHGHLELVEAFIKRGADVNAVDMLKMTPLHWACVENYYNIASYLINHDADIYLENKFDKTPYDVCIENANFKIAELIKSKDKDSEITPNLSAVIPMSSSESPKVQDFSSTNVLAGLAAIAQATSGSVNLPVASETLSWLQAEALSPSISLDNAKTLTFTDAGKLVMQAWGKKQEDEQASPIGAKRRGGDMGFNPSKIPKTDNNSKKSDDLESGVQGRLSSTDSDKPTDLSAPSIHQPDVSDLLVSSTSVPPSLSFSNIFSECSSSRSEEEGGMDLERDILQKQFEIAKSAASRVRKELEQRESEAKKYQLQLELLLKKQQLDTPKKF